MEIGDVSKFKGRSREETTALAQGTIDGDMSQS